MKATIAAVLAYAMLGTGQIAKAEDVCQCWQENTSVSTLFVNTRQALFDLNREEPNCHTRCKCHGLSIAGIVFDGATVCTNGWCISGGGGVDNGDGTVSLFAAGELSMLDHPNAPVVHRDGVFVSPRTVLAVGSGKCG